MQNITACKSIKSLGRLCSVCIIVNRVKGEVRVSKKVYGNPNKRKERPLRTQMRLKEELTQQEIEELMGVDRPIYVRKKGGAYKQK